MALEKLLELLFVLFWMLLSERTAAPIRRIRHHRLTSWRSALALSWNVFPFLWSSSGVTTVVASLSQEVPSMRRCTSEPMRLDGLERSAWPALSGGTAILDLIADWEAELPTRSILRSQLTHPALA